MATTKKRRLLSMVVVGAGITAAAWAFAAPLLTETLTGEQAKQALLNLMATRDHGPVGRNDITRFAGEPVERQGLGRALWGPFRIDLSAAQYEFELNFGEPPHANQEVYKGSFERRDGRWIALSPEVRWHANRVKSSK